MRTTIPAEKAREAIRDVERKQEVYAGIKFPAYVL
jgi:hypothetical protein